MAIMGGFSLGFAFPSFLAGEENITPSEFLQLNSTLYSFMLLGILVTLILDFIVSYTVFQYFKRDHKGLALASGWVRAIYTIVFAIATFYLLENLFQDNPSDLILASNYQLFESIWSGGLIIFGVHLVLTGILMKFHKGIPAILWVLTMIAGAAYILIHASQKLQLDPEMVGVMEMALTLPMIVGELGLAIWLLVKGGKNS